MKNFALFVGVCIVLIIAGVFGVGLWQNNSLESSDSANTISTASAKENKPQYAINDQALNNIQTLASNNSDLNMSVVVTDLQTGKTYNYGENSSYTAASIGKLVTATAYLHKVEIGNAKLDDNVGDGFSGQEALKQMIINSDNTAWHDIEMIETLDAQQSYAQEIGLSSYNVNDNTISSADVALLLTKLCSGKLFDDDHTQLLLSYMQQANYRDYIVAATPSDVSIYHKVGLLDDRLLEAAVLKKGNRSYVLVIFSKTDGAYDFSRGTDLFGGITKDTLQAFFNES